MQALFVVDNFDISMLVILFQTSQFFLDKKNHINIKKISITSGFC
jgi:hypothetical protein